MADAGFNLDNDDDDIITKGVETKSGSQKSANSGDHSMLPIIEVRKSDETMHGGFRDDDNDQ